AVLILLLSGCGFQLREAGVLPGPMERTTLVGLESWDPLYNELQQALQARGGEVVPRDEATARLEILENRTGRRNLSVGGDARVSEYEVQLRLTYRVQGVDSSFTVPRKSLTLSRDYLFDASGVLGRDEQERVLQEAMRRDAVELMMIHLQNVER
ncbi:MAG: LPS assembly lipoprotein LptE, partial [Ectothiorhodospira sp.]